MPDKLTDEQIVKELKRYSDVSDNDITTTSFKTRLLKEVYLFINRLQEENERLKEEIKKEQLYNLRMTAHSVKTESYTDFAESLKKDFADDLEKVGNQDLDDDEFVQFFKEKKSDVIKNMGNEVYQHGLMASALMFYLTSKIISE